MNVKELQQWLNDHGATPKLVTDGMGGSLTRAAFIQVFVNKNAKKITDEQINIIAKSLGEDTPKRLNAVAAVESGGAGWFDSGLPKILYERHYFYRLTKKTVSWLSFGYLGNAVGGGYTTDANNNGINDNWEKLASASCIDPDAAVESVSIGKFQIMGIYYKELGYESPIEMLWDASQSEEAHYKMLAGYIKMAKLTHAFSQISSNPNTNIPFVSGYNGPGWKKNDYANKLAAKMK